MTYGFHSFVSRLVRCFLAFCVASVFVVGTTNAALAACAADEIDVLGDGTQCEESKFEITTTSDTDRFVFSMDAAIGEFYVDWGDGTVDTITRTTGGSVDYSHTYATSDSWTIRFGGVATSYSGGYMNPNIRFYKSSNGTMDKIASISGSLAKLFPANHDYRETFRGAINLTTIPSSLLKGGTSFARDNAFVSMFQGCTGLTTIPSDLFQDISTVNNSAFDNMFNGCSALTTIPTGLFDNISLAGTSPIWQFKDTFKNCTSLTTIPDGLFDDILEGSDDWTDLHGMFQGTFNGCSSLTTIPDGLFSKLTNTKNKWTNASNLFNGVFAGCTSLTSIPSDLFSGITSGAEGMFSYAFQRCTSLTTIPSNLFSGITSGAEGMFSYVFQGCTSLTTIPSNLFSGITSGANNMFNSAFSGCTALTTVPALFRNITSAANTTKMFENVFNGCKKLTTINADLFENLGDASGTSYLFASAFYGCSALTTVPALFRNITSAANAQNSFSATFGDCKKLTTIDADLFENLEDVSGTSYLFNWAFGGCSALTTIPTGLFSGITNTSSSIGLFNYAFNDCSSLTTIPSDLFSSITAGETSMFDGAFKGCTSLTTIPSGLFSSITTGVAYTTNMFHDTFRGCSRLTTIPGNLFANITDVSESTSLFENTFHSCTSLTTIPAGLFANISNASNTTNLFAGTFNGDTNLASIPDDLFSSITESGQKMFYGTFQNCSGLRGKYIPSETFSGLIENSSPTATDMWANTFQNTGMVTICPAGTQQYLTGYEGTGTTTWDGYVSCTPCTGTLPEHSVWGNNDNCQWVCANGYTENNGECETIVCTGATYYDLTYESACRPCPDGYNYDTTSGKTEVSQCKIQCAAGTWTEGGYVQLEYIENTSAAQYIMTDYVVNTTNFAGHVVTQLSKLSDIGGVTPGLSFGGWNGTAQLWQSGSALTKSTSAFATGTLIDYEFSVNGTTRQLSVNGATASDNKGEAVSGTIRLFGNGSADYYMVGRIYSAQFYVDGDLALDLIPARRTSDNAIGMYDKVSGKFYTNSGTGNFVVGSDVASVSGGCVNVGKGYWAAASVVNYGSTGTRTACPIGTYSDIETGASAAACKSCTGATYNDTTGAAACTACPDEYNYDTTSGKTAASQCKIHCAAGTYVASSIPSSYTQIEYIESTSSSHQYIATGYTPTTNNMSGRLVVEPRQTGSHIDILGSSGLSVGWQNNFFLWNSNGTLAYSAAYSVGTKYDIEFDITSSGRTLTVNGNTVSDTKGGASTGELKINRNGDNYWFVGRTYRVTLYDDGVLVRDFVPVRRNSDGVNGMYDLVTKAFYPATSSGAFQGGGTVTSAGAGCTNVGTGYWAAASTINYGETGTRTACPIGTYSDIETGASAAACKSCTGATYNDTTGAAACTACPFGYNYNTQSGKTAASQCQLHCAAGTTVSSDYTKLAYIESTSDLHQYIETTYTPQTSNFSGRLIVSPTATSSELMNIMASSGLSVGYNTDGKFQLWSKAGDVADYDRLLTLTSDFVNGTQYDIEFEVTSSGRSLTVNGQSVSDNEGGLSTGVIKLNRNNDHYWFIGRTYRATFWDDGEMVMDLIPAKNKEGITGMYDMISGKFYTYPGAGVFTAGPSEGTLSGACANVGTGYWIGENTINYGDDISETKHACPAGTYSDIETGASAAACKSCTGATYNPTTAAAMCLDCPTGYTYNTTSGKTAANQCQLHCDGGSYATGGNQSLEYILATGQQYINTGISVRQLRNPTMEMTVQYTSAAASQMTGASTNGFKMGIFGSGKFGFLAGGSNSQTLFGDADTEKHTFIMDAGNRTCSLDGVEQPLTVAGLEDIEYQIYVGAVGMGSQARTPMNAKIYHFKLMSDGAVVLDMYPAQNASGDVGMIDNISGQFFPSRTNTFIAGPNVSGSGELCAAVGVGNWAAASTINYGESGTKNACPTGTTTVGYGHGADSLDDCGRKLHVGNYVLYTKNTKPSVPAINIRMPDDAMYYVGLSEEDMNLSKVRVGINGVTYAAYDDSLLYGERDFETDERRTSVTQDITP